MKYINSYYNIKIIFAHFFLVDLKRTSEQQQSKQNSRGFRMGTVLQKLYVDYSETSGTQFGSGML